MRLGREWLAAAAIFAVVAAAVTDLTLIVADDGSPPATASAPWSRPDVQRVVPMALVSTPAPPPSPPPAPVLPKLTASSVAIPVQHVRAPVIDYCPIIEGGLEP